MAIPYKDFNVATNIIQNFENPKIEKETRYRSGDQVVGNALSYYNAKMNDIYNKSVQEWQDNKLSIKILQKAVELETGEQISELQQYAVIKRKMSKVEAEKRTSPKL